MFLIRWNGFSNTYETTYDIVDSDAIFIKITEFRYQKSKCLSRNWT